MIEKRSESRMKKEIFAFMKNIELTKDQFVVSILNEFPKQHTKK